MAGGIPTGSLPGREAISARLAALLLRRDVTTLASGKSWLDETPEVVPSLGPRVPSGLVSIGNGVLGLAGCASGTRVGLVIGWGTCGCPACPGALVWI